jgi:NAD(P)-dependent dehydrogenase (short-subunit alcohol dehydrogenase family)
MTTIGAGTVLITGPTSGLGRALTLEIASRTNPGRPDLLLVGRPGRALTQVIKTVRTAGVTVREIYCDLSRLGGVRAAAVTAKQLLAAGEVRPLRALVANAGCFTPDTRVASADGYEMTFAVNYLAHAQLVGDLLDWFTPPARIVFLGSNTYRGTYAMRMIGIPAAEWRDPFDIARPATGNKPSGLHAAAVAYATSKLAVLYYAHELQRRAGDGIGVSVFEPGFMPGTGLARQQAPSLQWLIRILRHLPGTVTPERSAPVLASVVLDDRWAHLRDGAFITKGKETEVLPFARDRVRERELWDTTANLLRLRGTR